MPQKQKAAFDVSLGFIIAVVFAVILLSLAIVWIQSIIPQISQITFEVTEVARQELLNNLASSGDLVGLAAPAVTSWDPGETGSYALGILNSDPDRTITFYANVYLEDVSGGLRLSQVDQEAINDWISLAPATLDLNPSESDTLTIIIKPPTSAKAGIYSFRAAVCNADPGPEGCHATSPTVGFPERSPDYYDAEAFSIEILP